MSARDDAIRALYRPQPTPPYPAWGQWALDVTVRPESPVPAVIQCVAGQIELVIRPDVTAGQLGEMFRHMFADGLLDVREGDPTGDWELLVCEDDGTLRGV